VLLKRCDRFAKGGFTEMNVEQQSNVPTFIRVVGRQWPCVHFGINRGTHLFCLLPRNEKPRANAGLFFYLLCPARATVDRLGDTRGVKLLPKALPTVGLLGKEAAGPVLLHVGA
jgi:hypothetical protein